MKKINKKIKSVTIGIPAFNEELNIGKLLISILDQKQIGFKIKEIIILSDGSTDKTIQIAEEFNNKKISIIKGKIRKGKPTRISELFKLFDTNLLIMFDADVILANNETVKNIVKEFNNPKVGLVSGRSIPVEDKTLISKAYRSSIRAYERIYESLNRGNNAFSVNGCIIAVSENFAKSNNIPSNISSEDAYLYFKTITTGYKYKFTNQAAVLYQPPLKAADQVKQNKRFVSRTYELENIFGKNIVEKEYFIPKSLFYKSLLIEFLLSPIPSAYILFVNIYSKYSAFQSKNKDNSKWDMVTSSKKLNI